MSRSNHGFDILPESEKERIKAACERIRALPKYNKKDSEENKLKIEQQKKLNEWKNK